MKRKIILLSLLVALVLSSCKTQKYGGTMSLDGVEYPEIFILSGYYFDKASMSELTLGSRLEQVTAVDRPAKLGTLELPDFSTITLTNNPKEEIDDAMIEAELERERDKETAYTPVKVKRDAKMTDKVIIDFKGYMDGELIEGGSGEDYELVLGSGQFIPGFEEKVAGHSAGKRFSFDIQFPEDYDPSLAGKDAKFEVTIKSLEEAVTPEVNEEFVRKHTNENSVTVDQYKEEVKRRIESRNEYLNEQNLIYQLSDYLYENTKFFPTEEALAWQFSVIIDDYNKQAEQMGSTFTNMLKSNDANIWDVYTEIKNMVPQYVQSTMLMDEMKNRYKVNITEADVKKWFDNLSVSMGLGSEVSYEDYKTFAGYENLKNAVEQESVFKLALKGCNIVDKETEE